MFWFPFFAIFLKIFLVFGHEKEDKDQHFDEAILETWSNDYLQLCSDPIKNFAGDSIFSYRIQNGLEWINLEVRNFEPLLIRFAGFIPPHLVQQLQTMHDNLELEEQKVVDGDGSTVSKSRRAKGFWISKDDKNVVKIYQKLQNALTLDPKTSENFLILSYDKNGHYAPHYDYLNFTADSDNWWFVNYGDRLATALIIVKTADEGGATVFPKMKVVVSPEPGDVILWFNANLKFEQEDLSFHGACPILSGRKIAMSLWIRCKHHKDLGCQKTDAESLSHQLKNIIRNLGY